MQLCLLCGTMSVVYKPYLGTEGNHSNVETGKMCRLVPLTVK